MRDECREYVLGELDRLLSAFVEHISYEERLMKTTLIPTSEFERIEAHKEDHANLMELLRTIVTSIKQNTQPCETISHLSSGWLSQYKDHAVTHDREFVALLAMDVDAGSKLTI